ncbi:hypothetical protein [Mucilaginibacter antarcticus]|uniref:hypothetical protein n=1 Tax=Mucilaginibacter antarcticus TaxID=1855725 RepID=UPI00362BD246
MKIFKADYVFPIHADPIKDGVVTVDDEGTIISVTDQPPREPTLLQLHAWMALSAPDLLIPTAT